MSSTTGLITQPMGQELILWRCLHGGPIDPGNIDTPAPRPDIDWLSLRARNLPLVEKLVRTYGTCAIVAREGPSIVASLRFYPKALCEFGAGGAGFCLQQSHPAGPASDLVERDFPPLAELPDKTLFVHCLLIYSPPAEPRRYRRHGLASEMVRELIRWAAEHGWEAIEANAYEEIPWLYDISGVAGRRFWLKLGFEVASADREPGMTDDILATVRKEAVAAGIPAEKADARYRMRLALASG